MNPADLMMALVVGVIVTSVLLLLHVSSIVAVGAGLMITVFVLVLNNMSGPRIQH